MKDFFISYNKADLGWARWIGWVLEQAGHTVVLQDWDFPPGDNFVLDMHKALINTRATLVVLSNDYLNGSFTHPEWAAAFAKDPDGSKKLLVPLKVGECSPGGLLSQIVYVNLIGLEEPDARAALIGAFRPGRPSAAPAYPGSGSGTFRDQEAFFPGKPSHAGRDPITDRLAATVRSTVGWDKNSESRGAPFHQRIALMKDLNALPVALFNMLVVALKPTDGVIPPMPAPQAERSSHLMAWAESGVGCGLSTLIEALAAINSAS